MITGDHITHSDWEKFKASHASFLRLTPVEDITERCVQRKVFSKNAGEFVIECFEQKGPREAKGN